MKKLLTSLGVLIVLAAAALAIFIATFDADRFRPLLISRLSDALGRPVDIRHLALGWRGGVAIQAQGVTIGRAESMPSEPLLRVDSVDAVIRLPPLLHGRVEIASVVVVRPDIRLERDPQGRLELPVPPSASEQIGGLAPSGATVDVRGAPVSVSFQLDALRVQQGRMRWIDHAADPPTDLTLASIDAVVRHLSLEEPVDLEARAALGAEAPNLSIHARVMLPAPSRPGSIDQLKLSIDKLPLERVGLPAGRGEPQLQGMVSGVWEGRLGTLDPDGIARSASGTGRLQVADPVLKNLNVLRTIFEKFSIIPGLIQTLESRLPPDYQAKFEAADTTFAPIDLSVQLDQGWLQFDDLRVASDAFQLTGAGRIGLDGALDIRSRLRIDRPLSEALIRSVEELRALAAPSGELELPVAIAGRTSRVALLPDLNEIGSKLVVTTAVSALSHLFNRQDQPEPQTPGEQPGASDAVGGLLQRLLKPDAPANAPPSGQ